MSTIQQTAAEQWDLTLSQLREDVRKAIVHLQKLKAVTQSGYTSYEMGPEEWAEQAVELEYFIARDERTGISPEETVGRVFRLLRTSLQAGDLLVNFEEF